MEVARRLRGCVRHSDQMMEGALEGRGRALAPHLEAVGRLGGDEFVALLPEVADDATPNAWRSASWKRCASPSSWRAGVLRHRQRGHGDVPARRPTVADLMRNADVAMYSAKAPGAMPRRIYSPSWPAAGATSSSWKPRCTRPSSATSWCCTTSPRSTCARPRWSAPRR
jgi:GGDEF domain-containing protein